jgi:hypothetical protein
MSRVEYVRKGMYEIGYRGRILKGNFVVIVTQPTNIGGSTAGSGD